MRIVHLVAGAGGMYCGSCLHANALARGLLAAGADVTLVPLYTPLRTDEPSPAVPRVAMGGLNVYLQQIVPSLAWLPKFVRRALDHPRLLTAVGRMSSRTRAESLGPLTVSMLRGPSGRQRREVEALIDWLAADLKPQVIHLANALLVGLAEPLEQRLGARVVATLSGEDLFVEQLPEPYRQQARELMRKQAARLSAAVALNHYYADYMADYLALPRSRVAVIPPGLHLDDYAAERIPGSPERPFRLGYFGRIAPEKGLDLLAEAFCLLAADPRMPPAELHLAGYLAEADRACLTRVEQRLRVAGLGQRFRYAGELDRSAKVAFLGQLDLLALPSLHPESKGLPLLEALAAGTPVVAAHHGALGEWIVETGGGLSFRAGDARNLADAIGQLMLDPAKTMELGRHGQSVVRQRFHVGRMVDDILALYRRIAPA